MYCMRHYTYPSTHTHNAQIQVPLCNLKHTFFHPSISFLQLVCMYVQSLCQKRLGWVRVGRRVEQHGRVGVWARVRVKRRSRVGRVAWLGEESAGVVALQRRHALEPCCSQPEVGLSVKPVTAKSCPLWAVGTTWT